MSAPAGNDDVVMTDHLHVLREAPPETWLRGVQPSVLPLRSSQRLQLPIDSLQIAHLQANATFYPEHKRLACARQRGVRALSVRIMNPSIARAPKGLCPRCALVVAARADTLSQCNLAHRRSRHRRTAGDVDLAELIPFHATVIAVLDARLKALGWTWFLPCPEVQVSSAWVAAGITVAAGAADGFHAPFAKPAFDARLLFIPIPAGSSGNADGRDGELLITYTCSSCERRLTWAHLKVTADATPDGGLLNLRAWAVRTVDAIAPTATFDTPGYSWGGDETRRSLLQLAVPYPMRHWGAALPLCQVLAAISNRRWWIRVWSCSCSPGSALLRRLARCSSATQPPPSAAAARTPGSSSRLTACSALAVRLCSSARGRTGTGGSRRPCDALDALLSTSLYLEASSCVAACRWAPCCACGRCGRLIVWTRRIGALWARL